MMMIMMIRAIQSSLVKLILAQINFANIVSISFVAFEKQNPFRYKRRRVSLCSYVTKI